MHIWRNNWLNGCFLKSCESTWRRLEIAKTLKVCWSTRFDCSMYHKSLKILIFSDNQNTRWTFKFKGGFFVESIYTVWLKWLHFYWLWLLYEKKSTEKPKSLLRANAKTIHFHCEYGRFILLVFSKQNSMFISC